MFIEERHRAILEILEEKGSISTGEIQELYNVSYDSAKRDLRILEEKGLLKRTHGGAIKMKNIAFGGECHNLSASERVIEVKENYLKIAKRAVTMIKENDVVYITCASIGALIASNLTPDIKFTAVTNSLSIAEILRKNKNLSVILTGGEMSENGNFYDHFTSEMLRKIKLDKAFITSAAISAKFGLSIQKSRNIGLVQTVIENAKEVIGLYPHEKIGFDSILSICEAKNLNILITDNNTSEETLKEFDELGIEIIIAD